MVEGRILRREKEFLRLIKLLTVLIFTLSSFFQWFQFHIFRVNFIMRYFELRSISVWDSFSPNCSCIGHRIRHWDNTMMSNTFSLNMSYSFQQISLHNHRHLKEVRMYFYLLTRSESIQSKCVNDYLVVASISMCTKCDGDGTKEQEIDQKK